MSDIYGDFTEIVVRMKEDLNALRAIWTDSTARTYDCLDDNMIMFAQHIWECHERVCEGKTIVEQNYDENEADRIINGLEQECIRG